MGLRRGSRAAIYVGDGGLINGGSSRSLAEQSHTLADAEAAR
jgi:hypothetical protein